MSYMYTKEQIFTEFKDVTKKDQSKKKESSPSSPYKFKLL